MIKVINEVLDHGANTGIDRVLRKLNVTLSDEGRRKAEKVLKELEDLIDSKTKKALLVSTRVYLRRLKRLGLYTYWSLPLNKVLRPGSVTIVNLAG